MNDIAPGLPPIDDDDLLAGEYVLGVLDADARREAQHRIGADRDFALARQPQMTRDIAGECRQHPFQRMPTRELPCVGAAVVEILNAAMTSPATTQIQWRFRAGGRTSSGSTSTLAACTSTVMSSR